MQQNEDKCGHTVADAFEKIFKERGVSVLLQTDLGQRLWIHLCATLQSLTVTRCCTGSQWSWSRITISLDTHTSSPRWLPQDEASRRAHHGLQTVEHACPAERWPGDYYNNPDDSGSSHGRARAPHHTSVATAECGSSRQT